MNQKCTDYLSYSLVSFPPVKVHMKSIPNLGDVNNLLIYLDLSRVPSGFSGTSGD